jgi:hypothetical protein
MGRSHRHNRGTASASKARKTAKNPKKRPEAEAANEVAEPTGAWGLRGAGPDGVVAAVSGLEPAWISWWRSAGQAVIGPASLRVFERWRETGLACRFGATLAATETATGGDALCVRLATVAGWGPLGGVRRAVAGEAVEFSRELTVDEEVTFEAAACLGVAVPPERGGVETDEDTWALLPARAVAWTRVVGVETFVVTATEPVAGLALVLTVAEVVGVETVDEACVGALGETVAFVCVDTVGVETDPLAEAAGGAVRTEALVEAEAAGVETRALAVADGVGDGCTVTRADAGTGGRADAETRGGGGVPGRPSA